MILLSSILSINIPFAIFLLVTMMVLGFLKGQTHYIVWEYGEDQFRKRYLIHFFVYWIFAVILFTYINSGLIEIYLGLLAFVILDCIIFFIKDYSHMHEFGKFLAFVVASLFVSILAIEVTFLGFQMYLALFT